LKEIAIWVRAARLRTLPLSVSGILAGTALARDFGFSDPTLFGLLLATTIAYQITSNFANDYGDGIKGTDNDTRIGPRRVLQSGALSAERLKKGIWSSIAVSILLTLCTLWRAFGMESLGYFCLFLLLGGFAIWAAIRYTVGSNAYGYRGLGDLFVFLFFGLVSVMGSLFLYTQQWYPQALFPAVAIGSLSTAVLNLNNLRDSESDRISGKNTLVVQMGYRNGVRYHFALCLLAFISILCFVLLQKEILPMAWALLPFAVVAVHLGRVLRTKDPSRLDPELKKLALSTFFIALLLYFANDYFL
jgi:1,4-dihydroxy-2-naphthoate octaprenyltransferase